MKKINIYEFIMKILLAINFVTAIKIPILEDFIENITYIYFAINMLSFLALIIVINKINLKGFIKYIIIYYLILSVSTLFNSNGDTYTVIYEFITVFCTILIWNSLSKEKFKKYEPVMVTILEMLTYANFVCILLYPNGLYNIGAVRKYYLFGHVNIAIRYLLPGCCLTFIRSYMHKNKLDIRAIVYLIISFATLLLTWTATALVGFVIFIAILFVIKRNKIIKNFLYPNFMYLYTSLASYLIIGMNIQNKFSNIIEKLLHKDVSFSGRILIWERSVSYIKQRFLLGYGRMSIEKRYSMLSATSSHNQFLVFLFEGGLVMVSYFLILMIIITKKLKQCKNRMISGILVSTIASYLIMWISEPFSYSAIVLTFIILFLSYKSFLLFDSAEEKENLENE